MTRQDFISEIKDGVIAACNGTGLFPSVMIAQGCLESANGASELSAKYNNYFGMKTGSTWKGKVANMPTTEDEGGKIIHITQPFRVYDNIEDCFKDHVCLLQRIPIYTQVGIFKSKTPEEQCQHLQGTYATDTHYASKLIEIINENNLKQYDI